MPLKRHPLRHVVRPTLFVLVLLTQIPFFVTIWYSLQRWNLLTPQTKGWVGLENYKSVVTMPSFGTAVVNTVMMTVLTVVIVVVLGLILALLVDRTFRTRGLARTLLFAPFLIPAAASALMWKTSILNPTYGLLNWVLGPLGQGGVDWANQYPMATIVVVIAWQWTPFAMIILLAGLQSMKASTKEAAMVDGARPWQIFRYLTMPHLRPYLEITALLSAIFVSQVIDPIVLITQGGPGDATTTLPYLIYNTAFRGFDIGMASAMGVIVVVATVVIATILVRLTLTVFKEDAV